MNVMSNISEDRKHLLEKRMLNQDQHQYLSPQQQQANNKNSVSSASKINEETRSTVADSTASPSISHGNIDTKATLAPPSSIAAVEMSSVASSAIDSSVLKPSTLSVQVPSISGTVAPIIEELPEIDESKVSENSRSHSRSIQHSPALKSEKDKENKADPNVKSTKRQSHGSFENRSPKLAKHEENIHHDQSAAINQGWFLCKLASRIVQCLPQIAPIHRELI